MPVSVLSLSLCVSLATTSTVSAQQNSSKEDMAAQDRIGQDVW